MEFHTKEMFTLETLEELFASELLEKETAEFKRDNLLNQIIDIKKKFVPDLYVYETKKIHNPDLVPNKNVLTQIKILEKNATYLTYKAEIESYNRIIRNIDNKIIQAANDMVKKFKFVPYNLKQYIQMFKEFIANKDEYLFDKLMENIFNNEFFDKSLYRKLRIQRNYPVFGLLIEKCPVEYEPLFKYLILQIQQYDIEKEIEYINKGILVDFMDIIIQMELEYNELLEELK